MFEPDLFDLDLFDDSLFNTESKIDHTKFKRLNNTKITLYDGEVVDKHTHIITVEGLPDSYKSRVIREAIEILRQNKLSAKKVILKINGFSLEITHNSTLNSVLSDLRNKTKNSHSNLFEDEILL